MKKYSRLQIDKVKEDEKLVILVDAHDDDFTLINEFMGYSLIPDKSKTWQIVETESKTTQPLGKLPSPVGARNVYNARSVLEFEKKSEEWVVYYPNKTSHEKQELFRSNYKERGWLQKGMAKYWKKIQTDIMKAKKILKKPADEQEAALDTLIPQDWPFNVQSQSIVNMKITKIIKLTPDEKALLKRVAVKRFLAKIPEAFRDRFEKYFIYHSVKGKPETLGTWKKIFNGSKTVNTWQEAMILLDGMITYSEAFTEKIQAMKEEDRPNYCAFKYETEDGEEGAPPIPFFTTKKMGQKSEKKKKTKDSKKKKLKKKAKDSDKKKLKKKPKERKKKAKDSDKKKLKKKMRLKKRKQKPVKEPERKKRKKRKRKEECEKPSKKRKKNLPEKQSFDQEKIVAGFPKVS